MSNKTPGFGKGQGGARLNAVLQEHVAPELVALAQLLSARANPAIVKKRAKDWVVQLPAFRKAMVTVQNPDGKLRRRRHDIPPEIVEDERVIVLQEVAWLEENAPPVPRKNLEEWLKAEGVRHEVKSVLVRREIPGGQKYVPLVASYLADKPGTSRPSRGTLINQIIATRLGISQEKAKKDVGANREFGGDIGERESHHRLLASLYLDLISIGGPLELQMRVLDALYLDRYHVLMVYYLVQQAHSLPTGNVKRVYEDDIRKLCDAVHSVDQSQGPFTQFVLDCRSDVENGA